MLGPRPRRKELCPGPLAACRRGACGRARPRLRRSLDTYRAGRSHRCRAAHRKIATGPPIRRDRDLLEDFSYLSIDRPISPSLVGDFTGIARVEYERSFQQSIVFAFVATVSASDVP